MKRLWVTAIGLFFSGCLVGPNYKPPIAVVPEVFHESLDHETVCIEDKDFFRWWKQLDDELLNELLCEAAHYNFDLRIAFESIQQARGQFDVQSALRMPQINLDTVVTRTRNSEAVDGQPLLGPRLQNFFLVGFDAIWEIDFFGRLERNRRSAFDLWQASCEDARQMQIVILSEVARNYVLIRSLQKKVDLAHRIVEADVAENKLVEDRFHAGLATCINLEESRAILDLDWAFLNNQESLLQQNIYAMGVLVGKPPEWVAEKLLEFGPIPKGTGRIPAGLPAELLRRRHDIKSAERNLASTTELIGAKIAELFPKVTLTSTNLFGARSQSANFGWASSSPNNLFKEISKTWSIGPAISLPLIDWGQRAANVDIQTSMQRAACLNYQKTVLTALQEVEQALIAYFKEEERQFFLRSRVEADQRAYQYTFSLMQAGLASCPQVWDAQKVWLSAELDLTDSEQFLTTDLIALYKALGGDWECFYSQ